MCALKKDNDAEQTCVLFAAWTCQGANRLLHTARLQ